MYQQRDISLLMEGIKYMEDSNDDYYNKQVKNIKELNLKYDDLVRLAAYFSKTKYIAQSEQRKISRQLEVATIDKKVDINGLVYPAYKNNITPEIVKQAVRKCNGNKQKAAEMLGVSIKTIYNRLREE